MKTRILHTRFWKDEYISNLSVKERLLFVYLLTNENVNMCGIYELPDKYICVDIGLTKPELSKIKQKFITDDKFFFSKGWVKIFRHDKYNSYGKGMQEKALEKELLIVPQYMLDTSIDTSIDTRPNTETINKNIEIRNKKEEKKKEIDVNAIQVLEWFNHRHSTKFKSTGFKVNLEHWLEEYTMEDIKRAIYASGSGSWWAKKPSVNLLFRKKSTKGEPVDYIGELLNLFHEEVKE